VVSSVSHGEGFTKATTNSVVKVMDAADPRKAGDYTDVTIDDIQQAEAIASSKTQTFQQKEMVKRAGAAVAKARMVMESARREITTKVAAVNPQTPEAYADALIEASKGVVGADMVLPEMAANLPEAAKRTQEQRGRRGEAADFEQQTKDRLIDEGLRRDMAVRQNMTPEQIEQVMTDLGAGSPYAKALRDEYIESKTSTKKEQKEKKAKFTHRQVITKPDLADKDQAAEITSIGGLGQQHVKIITTKIETPVTIDDTVRFRSLSESANDGAVWVTQQLAERPGADDVMELAVEYVTQSEERDETTVEGDQAKGRRYLAQQIVKAAQSRSGNELEAAQERIKAIDEEMFRSMDTKVDEVEIPENPLAVINQYVPGTPLADIAEAEVAKQLALKGLTEAQQRHVDEAVEEYEVGSNVETGLFAPIHERIGSYTTSLRGASVVKQAKEDALQQWRDQIAIQNQRAGDLTGWIDLDEARQAGVDKVKQSIQVRFPISGEGVIRWRKFQDASPGLKVAMWKTEEARVTREVRVQAEIENRVKDGLEEQEVLERNLDAGVVFVYDETGGGLFGADGEERPEAIPLSGLDPDDRATTLGDAKRAWGKRAAELGLLPEQIKPVFDKFDQAIQEAESESKSEEVDLSEWFEKKTREFTGAQLEEEIEMPAEGRVRHRLPDGRIVDIPPDQVSELPEGSEAL